MLSHSALLGFNAFTDAAAPAAGFIISIQQFSITLGSGVTSNTATISAVDTSKSVIVWGGNSTGATGTSTNIGRAMSRVTLTNSTTVTADRTDGTTATTVVNGTVVEFNPAAIQSVQYGTITLASVTTNTATISSVTTTNAACFYLGNDAVSTVGGGPRRYYANVVLTNATTVTATRQNSNAGEDLVVGFCVLEFAPGVLNSSTQQFSVSNGASSTTGTATISAVTTGQTMLAYGGFDHTGSSAGDHDDRPSITLTNGTTITLNRTDTSATTATVKGTVIEFDAADITSINRGAVALSTQTSNTATISAVNTAKTVVSYLGASSIVASSYAQMFNRVALTNSTTVTATTASSTVLNAFYEAIEFST